MELELYILHYAGVGSRSEVTPSPFGIVVFSKSPMEEVHWLLRDDLNELASDSVDASILAGTSDLFMGAVSTLGPRGLIDWMVDTLSLTIRFTGPRLREVSESAVDEQLLQRLFAETIDTHT